MKYYFTILLFVLGTGNFFAQQIAAPKPTPQQLQWHQMEFYFFIHFGPNTFTDKEWGHGDEPEDLFNPTRLDCRQWCRIAKQSGAKGIIITAKHHDGFCLWPSKYSKHTVRESKWQDGKGDVLRDLSKACKEYGLKFGVYISPWDRNHPRYGTAAYNDVYVNTMKEIFTNYGPLFELWWDGANGEGPNGKKMVYNFARFEKTVRAIAPKTVVFSDIGPDIRWVGNESGFAGKTNWNMLDTAGFGRGATAPETSVLNNGNEYGKNWIPAECDVSIRPGWFYHKEEDDKVKTPEQLFDLYLKSVGRGANLLLNIPPDRAGLINERDSAALVGFSRLRDENFSANIALKAKVFMAGETQEILTAVLTDNNAKSYVTIKNKETQYIHLQLPVTQKINCLVFKENIKNGQSVGSFYFQLRSGKNLQSYIQTTIGNKRIVTFPAAETDDIFIHFTKAKAKIEISEIGAYLIDKRLVAQRFFIGY